MAMVVGWCVRVRTSVCACMRACAMCLQYIYGNNIILPRLKMIIIKIIFLFFKEIAHTDDLPSTIFFFFLKNFTDYDNNCSSVVICMYASQITRMLCD